MASIPPVIDNQERRLADVLNALLDRCPGGTRNCAALRMTVAHNGKLLIGRPRVGERGKLFPDHGKKQ